MTRVACAACAVLAVVLVGLSVALVIVRYDQHILTPAQYIVVNASIVPTNCYSDSSYDTYLCVERNLFIQWTTKEY